MQTQAVCTSAKQHGPTGIGLQSKTVGVEALAPPPHIHTSRALLGLALTWPQAGHFIGSRASSHPPALPRARPCSPKPLCSEIQGSLTANNQGAQFKSSWAILLWAETLRQMHPEEAVVSWKCNKLNNIYLCEEILTSCGGFLTKPLGLWEGEKVNAFSLIFLIRLLKFVKRC